MKILQLCPKPPLPSIDGGCRAMHSITEGLIEEGHHPKIFTLSTHKHPFLAAELSEKYLESTGIVHADLDTRISFLGATLSLLRGTPYILDRFFDEEVEEKLSGLLSENSFDVIHFESLYMAPYLGSVRKLSKAPCVLRTHNIEYLIWQELASYARGFRKLYFNDMAFRLKKKEQMYWNQFDGIVPISGADALVIKEAARAIPAMVIPFAIESKPEIHEVIEPNSLFHLGAMDWKPNRQGIDWFLKKIWPKILEGFPLARFHLAGKSMPSRYFKLKMPHVYVEGEQAHSQVYISHKELMVVPLLSGSGVRIKILEGMAAGKAVVTTTRGAAGIGAVDGKHLFIADDPGDFARIVIRLLKNKEEARTTGELARKFIGENFNPQRITTDLVEFYRSLQHP